MTPSMSDRERENAGPVRFTETQRFDQLWLWLVLLASTVVPFIIFTWIMVEQLVTGHPVGNQPMPDAMAIGVWLGTGALTAGLLVLFARAALIVEVRRDGIWVQYKGFRIKRLIRYDEIASFEAVTYSPIGEYGGWGIRGMGKNKAYNVKGNRGVRLRFHDGSQLLVGSQRARAFERAIAHFANQ